MLHESGVCRVSPREVCRELRRGPYTAMRAASMTQQISNRRLHACTGPARHAAKRQHVCTTCTAPTSVVLQLRLPPSCERSQHCAGCPSHPCQCLRRCMRSTHHQLVFGYPLNTIRTTPAGPAGGDNWTLNPHFSMYTPPPTHIERESYHTHV